jgi:hypothetical protein
MPAATEEAAPVAEAEPTGPRVFRSVEDMVMAYHPEWAYLANKTLPVRPPTEEEAAALAARATDDEWIDLYQPPEPHIVLPPSPEVAAIVEAAGRLELPAAEGDGGDEPELVLDPRLEAAMADFNQAHDEQDEAETRTFTAALARADEPDE